MVHGSAPPLVVEPSGKPSARSRVTGSGSNSTRSISTSDELEIFKSASPSGSTQIESTQPRGSGYSHGVAGVNQSSPNRSCSKAPRERIFNSREPGSVVWIWVSPPSAANDPPDAVGSRKPASLGVCEECSEAVHTHPGVSSATASGTSGCCLISSTAIS